MAILNGNSQPCVKGGERHMTERADTRKEKRRVCMWCQRWEAKRDGVWQAIPTPPSDTQTD